MLIIKSRHLHLWEKYPKGRRVGIQISPGYVASKRPDWPEPVSTTTKTTGEVRGGSGGIYPSVVNACHHSSWEGKARRTRSWEPITPQVNASPASDFDVGLTAQPRLASNQTCGPAHPHICSLPCSSSRVLRRQVCATKAGRDTFQGINIPKPEWGESSLGMSLLRGECESLALMKEKQISLVFAPPCHRGFHIIYLKLQITAKPHSNYNTNRIRSLVYK